ncbi:exonuclease SbcCD subunit D [Coprobacter sp.]
MKLIHTADWHIGQSFYGYSRDNEHRVFFEWLRAVTKKEKADALLIAGDVFDTPNPPASAQRLFYHFLRDITKENPYLQVIIISGNHDSAARLEAPMPLLESMNITVKGIIKKDEYGIDYSDLITPICDKDGNIHIWCMAVPYIRQGDYPPADSYAQGVKKMYEAVYKEALKHAEPGQMIIAMGHLQATGSEISEDDRSERTIIGGLDCISPDVFAPEIVYTALGHLHKGQRVSKRDNVRYAGTPLPMSFAEKNYKHGVEIVELDRIGKIDIRREIFNAPIPLQSVPEEARPIENVLQAIDRIDPLSENYIEILVSVNGPEPSLNYKIEQALENKRVRLTRILRKPAATSESGKKKITDYDELKKISPAEMAKEVFLKKYGSDMPRDLENLLNEVIAQTEI